MVYLDKTIGIVIPCFNEQSQVGKVIKALPAWIDSIIVIDDASTDQTSAVIAELRKCDNRISQIIHQENSGVGAAIASGYEYAKSLNLDITVVMAGDNQMSPDDLPRILNKMIQGNFDYVKTNRLYYKDARSNIPKVRFFGNYILSILTKFASGYWNINDSQSGYAAISNKALNSVDWSEMYPRYGQPNDILVLLNIANCRVADVPTLPIYGVGESSKMKIRTVAYKIPALLLRRTFYRISKKYFEAEMHPIFLFFVASIFFFVVGILLLMRMLYMKFITGFFPIVSTISCLFSFSVFLLLLLFVLWFDYEKNLHLQQDI